MAKGGQKDHSGMNKETYDRHYTANKYVGGHHGSPAHMKGSQSDHGQSSKEFADHEARVGTDGHSPAKMVSPLNDKSGKGSQGDHRMTNEAFARHKTVHDRDKDTKSRIKEKAEMLAATKNKKTK